MRSLQQAPSRQAARCSAAEAPAAGSPGPAGSPQAARRHVRAAVSDLDCSLPAPRRPSGSGSAGAMSRVGGALREQRGDRRLREARRALRVVGCLPVLRPLCPADVGQPLLVHRESRRVGLADHLGPVRMGVPHRPQMVRSASSAGCMVRRAAVARSGLTVHFLYVLSARGGTGTRERPRPQTTRA